LRYIELFAGIGGFRVGLEKAGGFSCVYSNEFDRYANSVYRKHFGECDIRDIKTVQTRELPQFDMLVGGFPCQSFSVAGKRKGFSDIRGTMFFEVIRIAQEKLPSLVLLENVKGLLNHDKGETFATMLFALDEIGYNAQWEVLNTQNFGIPQHRERIFIIATPRERDTPKIFPIGEIDSVFKTEDGDQREGKERICSTIDSRYGALRGCGETYIQTKKNHQSYRVYGIDGNACTLQGLAGGIGAKTGLYNTEMGIRRLTPIETERLQGFEDDWTKYGHDGQEISDTRRYKMMGNAVSTNVIQVIGERIKQTAEGD